MFVCGFVVKKDFVIFVWLEETVHMNFNCVCGVCIINTFLSNEFLDYLV